MKMWVEIKKDVVKFVDYIRSIIHNDGTCFLIHSILTNLLSDGASLSPRSISPSRAMSLEGGRNGPVLAWLRKKLDLT